MSANDHGLSEYSLWLEPAGSVRDQLKLTIADLARKSDSPTFDPHVTLLGGITLPVEETMKKLQALVQDEKKFTLSLQTLGMTDFYYKSIFLECEKTDALAHLNEKAQKLFSVSYEYNPHLSLLYSDADRSTKEKLITAIGADLSTSVIFEAASVSLWKNHGTADAWVKVDGLSLIDNI